MPRRQKINLGHVQKTLLLPLWGRAMESRKAKPLLADEAAARIVERVDYDFTQLSENIDPITQIAWIRRSQLGDQVVKKFLASFPEGTVVNIGCGLDTTFDRVDNGRLQWYDLDLPDVIELRKKFIPETPRRKLIPASFLDREWLGKIKVRGNVFFLAAGVFYYFEEYQVKEFVLRILDAFPGGELLFDACSTLGMRVANRKVIESSGLDERSHLKWGLKSGRDILAWDSRIAPIDTYGYFGTLRIGIRNLLFGMVSDFLKIQFLVHLRLGRKS